MSIEVSRKKSARCVVSVLVTVEVDAPADATPMSEACQKMAEAAEFKLRHALQGLSDMEINKSPHCIRVVWAEDPA